jgi:MFS family permease
VSRLRGYTILLGSTEARMLAAGGLIGHLREGGVGLAIVLAVHDTTGSFTDAGFATASFAIAAAVSRPFQGRLIDRTKPRTVLRAGALANAAALITLAIATASSAGNGGLIALAALVGVTLPALSATLRALWPDVAPQRLDRAYALDTLLYEISLIAAPALVGIVSSLASPASALLTLAALGSAGTLIVAGAPSACRAHDHAERTSGAKLFTITLILLGATGLFVGFAEGSTTVVVPAFATGQGAPGASGPLLSGLAVGSVIGAVAYGARAWTSPPARRLIACTTCLAASFTLLAAFAHGLAAFAAMLVVAGLALSPTLTTIFIAVQRSAPASSLAEAFAWISFATPAGAAGGQALAGTLVSTAGLQVAAWQPALGATAALALSCLVLYHASG